MGTHFGYHGEIKTGNEEADAKIIEAHNVWQS
jgi:hypothetical protein